MDRRIEDSLPGKCCKLIKLPRPWKICNGAGSWKAVGILWSLQILLCNRVLPYSDPTHNSSSDCGNWQRRIYACPWALERRDTTEDREGKGQKHLEVNVITGTVVATSQLDWLLSLLCATLLQHTSSLSLIDQRLWQIASYVTIQWRLFPMLLLQDNPKVHMW